ncbi:MAG TPA: NADH-quinone oxidoreductase subunit NuoN [Actinomycetes bacterium]|nr:NADH-quinone oxidoreductase subunit NuoN [Actinomycetes bacterium]
MQLLAQTTDAPLQAPEVAWRAIAPELALAGAGLALLMVVAFWPGARRSLLAALTVLGLAVAAGLVAWNWDLSTVAFGGAVSLDGITRYARVVLLAVGALAALMAAAEGPGGRQEGRDGDRESPPEVFPLLLFALTGMVLLAAASDLLVVFISLEMLSLALYVMAGATRRYTAQEAAMKYFLLGAFSSGFLLYGIALCYGATGSTNLAAIARTTAGTEVDIALLLAGVALLAVGFCFKVAAVPFHMWTPDVYQGAPTPVTAFMAAGTKAAGFAVFLRVFAGALGGLVLDWRPVIVAVAVLTMLVGSVLAIVQTDLKRMLAYSSISHAGYLLIGLAAAPTHPEGISASMFYLLAYAFMVMGSFMVVQYASQVAPEGPGELVRTGLERAGEPVPAVAGGAADDPDPRERSSLDDFHGFGRRHPLPAALLALFMFALAGIPPLSGFWAKYYVFQAGVNAGLTWLVVIGVISSVISAFFYLRVIMVTYLQEPAAGEEPEPVAGQQRERPAPEPRGGRPPIALGLALGVAALLTVAIGLAPQALVTAAQTAGRILG